MLTQGAKFCLEGIGGSPIPCDASDRAYVLAATTTIAFGAFFFMHDVRANVPGPCRCLPLVLSTQRQRHF